MPIAIETLLTLVPRAEDRERLLELARCYREAQADGILEEVMRELDRHWRAIRRPMPTRDEIVAMLLEE